MTTTPTPPETVMQRVCRELGLPVPKTPEQREEEIAAALAAQKTESALQLFARLQVDPADPKLVAAARAAIVPWLTSLPPARLQHPFFMREFSDAIHRHLTLARIKHTRLAPRTIAIVLYELGFTRGRDNGSNRPQTRYWMHPAAAGKKPKE